MKKLELTEKQRIKLLEMCNKLFPEYDFVFHHSDEGDPDDETPFAFLPGFIMAWEEYYDGEHSEYYHDVDIFIHWFEFCMTHLLDRMNLDRKEIGDKCLGIKNKLHIVDYIYNKFEEMYLNFES